tara:strand:+ start:209 stop:1006 length:798 start_codon:yes stop_codon:yes gene_type:complete
MIKKMLDVSIILPTFNEDENLKILIPDLINNLSEIEELSYEIIVVDDNSTDRTNEVVNKIKETNNQVKLKVRGSKPSLPLSIYEGIEMSQYKYVMWMDADCSMPADVVKKLIEKLFLDTKKVIIGSRFAEGGGYKGIESDGSNSLINVIKNIYKSEDSLIAVFLSRIFNFLLIFLLNSKVKDITSGFIVGKKEYFKKEYFSMANYGDYFVYLVAGLDRNKIDCEEVGYICLTREYGQSKTANNLLDLTLKGWPYIKAAFISRINK